MFVLLLECLSEWKHLPGQMAGPSEGEAHHLPPEGGKGQGGTQDPIITTQLFIPEHSMFRSAEPGCPGAGRMGGLWPVCWGTEVLL